METMQKDERDLLDVLKFELEFLEKGGYQPSPRQPRGFHLIFEDSPTCMNYDSKQAPAPCSECVLMALVPPESRNRPLPCRHIPLNSAGETLESLYRYAEQRDLEEVYRSWLIKTIAAIEKERAKATAGAGSPQAAAGIEGAPAEPLFFRRMHPKCANPSCPASFHWMSGGRFFRFRADEVLPTSTADAVENADSLADVKHYWLCESCGHIYTLKHAAGVGVVVEPRWRELPAGKPAAA